MILVGYNFINQSGSKNSINQSQMLKEMGVNLYRSYLLFCVGRYLKCVSLLIRELKKCSSEYPVLVNTMGWVQVGLRIRARGHF